MWQQGGLQSAGHRQTQELRFLETRQEGRVIIAQDREGGQEGYVLGLRARGRGGDRMGRAGGEKDVLGELCRTVWNPLFVVVRLLSCFRLFTTPRTAVHQATCPSLSPGVASNSRPLGL